MEGQPIEWLAYGPFGGNPVDQAPAVPLIGSPAGESWGQTSAFQASMSALEVSPLTLSPEVPAVAPLSTPGSITGLESVDPLQQALLRDELLGDVLIAPAQSSGQAFIAQWTYREAAYDNEVGIYEVDSQGRVNGVMPNDPRYAIEVLASPTRKVLFNSGHRAGNWKRIFATPGSRLAFYLVPNGSSQSLLGNVGEPEGKRPSIYFSVNNANTDGFDHARSRDIGDGIWRFNWEDMRGGGDQDFNDVVFNFGLEGNLIPGAAGMSTPLNVSRLPESVEPASEFGYFFVDGSDGSIDGLSPGSEGYLSKALAAGRRTMLHGADIGQTSRSIIVPAGVWIGWYLVKGQSLAQALATKDPAQWIFLSYAAANADGLNHVHADPVSKTMAWEGSFGGGDREFNQFRFRFDYGAPFLDKPDLPVVSVEPTSQSVNEKGNAQAFFVLRLSKDSSNYVSVDYATEAGSATAGLDYVHTKGSVVFRPGQLEATIAVPLLDDLDLEGTETFGLVLIAALNAQIGTKKGYAEILDNDTGTHQDAIAPVADNETSPLQEGGTSANLALLAGDTDAPDDPTGAGLKVAQVNGITLASLTPQDSGPYAGFYAISGSNGTLQVKADGTAFYVHNGSDSTADSFTYRAVDAAGNLSNLATIGLAITPVDDTAPVADNESATLLEGGISANLALLAGDTDAPDDPTGAGLKVAQVNGITLASLTPQGSGPYAGFYAISGSNGTLQVKADGTAFYVHNGSDTTSDSFSYRAVDATGNLSNLATINLAITPVDDNAPVAEDESATLLEGGTSGNLVLLVGDTDGPDDPSGTGLSVAQVNGVALASLSTQSSGTYAGYYAIAGSNGTLYVKADGTAFYVHNGSETSSDSFSYRAVDAAGNVSNSASIQLTMTSVDDTAPVADNESATLVEGGTSGNLALLLGDTDAPDDPSGTGLQVAEVNGVVLATLTPLPTGVYAGFYAIPGSNGTLYVKADGTAYYVHNGSETSSDSFSYRAVDAAGNLSNNASIQLTMMSVDDTAPVADNESATLVEGGTSGNLALLLGDTDVPDDPSGAGLQVAEVNGVVLATLAPLPTGVYAGFYAIPGSNGTLYVKANGTAYYVHNGSDTTSDSFTYRAVDAVGNLSNMAKIGLFITSISFAPTLSAGLANDSGSSNSDKITQDPSVTGATSGALRLLGALDVLSYQDLSELLSPDGTFMLGVQAYQKLSDGFMPDGAYELLLKAVSASGEESAVERVIFTLDTTAPDITFDLASQSSLAAVSGERLTTQRSVTLMGLTEAGLDVRLQNTSAQTRADQQGVFSFSDVSLPSAGTAAFTMIATDLAGNQGRNTQNISRVGLNGAPKITSSPETSVDLKTTTLYSYKVAATDPDQDPLAFVLVRGPKDAQLSTDGLLTFNPEPATDGDYSVVIQVNDGRGGVDQQEFVVTARLNPDTGTIRGAVWDDRNRNGIWDRGTADSTSEVLIDNGTNVYFNGFIGDLYPGDPSSPLASYFPGPNGSTGDPSVRFAVGPDLTGIEALGDWLGSPESALKNQNWSSLGKIPFSWPTNAELAIIYEIDGGKFGIDNLRGNFGADNGIYVWINGEFRFGALDPGPTIPNEYANIDLGSLKPCKNYIQVLLEDHGVILGYDVKITGNRRSGQGELGIGHSTTYLDLDNNGSLDAGEPRRHTSGSSTDPCVINEGAYEFSGLLPGVYTVRNDLPKGWDQTYPVSQYLEQDIAVNGSFEIAPSGDALGLGPGSSIIEGWNVTQGTVDSIVSWQASNGRISLDLDGTAGFGGVSQTFDTIVGRRYHVQFDLAGNSLDLPVVKRMEVSAGSDRETYEFDTTGKTYQSMGWMERTFEFTATDVKSTLQFRSLNQTGGIAGPALDNVRIYPILEKDNAWIVDVRAGDIKDNINFGITRNTSYTGDHDLQITSIDAEQLTIDPQLISVEGKLAATITNAGVDAVNKPFRVGFFEDRNFNKAYDPDLDTLLTTVEVSDPLAAGQSLVVSADLSTFMAFAQAPIWGVVDLDNVVLETDETNNLNFSSSDCIIDTPAVAAPDLVTSYLRSNDSNGSTTIQARIGNAGSIVVAAGVSVAFYDGDPRTGGHLLGTALTSKRLEVGEFEDVSLTVASHSLNTIWLVADDDGTGVGKVRECDELNNFYSLLGPGKGEIRGTVWSDRNGNGVFEPVGDTAEPGQPGVTVYLDVNDNGRLDAGEPSRVTSRDNPRTADSNETGQFRFTNLSYGAYKLRQQVPSGFQQTTPANNGSAAVLLSEQEPLQQLNLGNGSTPLITSTPLRSVVLGSTYRYAVQTTDAAGGTLSYRLLQAPEGMAISASGLLSWTPASPGSVPVALEVRNAAEATVTQSFDLAVEADLEVPLISLRPNGTVFNPGDTLTLTVSASDNVAVRDLRLTLNGVPLSLIPNLPNQPNQASVILSQKGSYTIQATATDSSGNVATSSLQVRVPDPADTVAPDIDFVVTPFEASKPLTDLANVLGSITGDPDAWRVELAPLDLVDPANPASPDPDYITIASGSSNVVSTTLATIDPSLFRNDSYLLRVIAQDFSGNVNVKTQVLGLFSEEKPADFKLDFTDLTIPLTGLPIQVGRSYSSLNAQVSGDFGYGWSLSFQDAQIQETAPDGRDLKDDDLFFGNGITVGTRITLTNAEGRRVGFTFDPQVVGSFFLFGTLYRPYFRPDPGVFDTLDVVPDPSAYDNLSLANLGPLVTIRSDGSAATPGFIPFTYNPSTYYLRNKAGDTYQYDQNAGLIDITDRNGNTLTYSNGGIASSTGQSISFTRDSQGRITEIRDPEGKVIKYSYNALGELVGVTDRAGNTTTMEYKSRRPHYLSKVIDPLGRSASRTEYDDQGRIKRILDADGNALDLSYDPNARVQVVTDPLGNSTTRVFDVRGNVIKEIDALGGITERTYFDSNLLKSVTDPEGNTTSYSYDNRGNKLTETNGEGETKTFTYTTTNKLKTETDALGFTTSYEYDGSDNLKKRTDPLGFITTYSYEPNGLLKSVVDANGKTTTFTYDSLGRVKELVDPTGAKSTFTYDGNGQVKTVTDAKGAVTLYTYDAQGRLIEKADPEGSSCGCARGITKTEYNKAGEKIAETDALGRRTEYRYNSRGLLVETILPDETPANLDDNPRLRSEYDALDRLITSTDELGRSTRFTYDKLGRKEFVIHPDDTPADLTDNPRSQMVYDKAGRLVEQIDERGNRRTMGYDKAGRLISETDGEGHTTSHSYDDAGRKISSTDPLGHKTVFDYDRMGRLIKTTNADGSFLAYTYDALGRKLEEKDQAGKITKYEYDALGRLTAVVDALNQRTEYGYDAVGNLTTQKDANGNLTTFTYDSLRRRVSSTMPGGQVKTTIHNKIGNLIRSVDANGVTTTYTYDARNRLIEKAFSDGTPTETFTYTATGQLETVQDNRGTTNYLYNARDWLLSRTDPDGRQISYSYDAAGNVTSLNVPSGRTTYTYDRNNRIDTVTDPDGGLSDYDYDATGNLSRTSFANGVVETREYDKLNRLLFLENRGVAGVLSSYRYTLDAVGNRTQVLEADGRKVLYSYDDLYRLTQEQVLEPGQPGRTITFEYDKVGNRLKRTDSLEGTTTYSYDVNDRLLQEVLNGQTLTYSYDNNGSLTAKASNGQTEAEYRWNAKGELAGATINSGGTTATLSYEYDQDGIRVAATVNGQETRFLIDKTQQPYAQVIEEYLANGSLLKSYSNGWDLLSQDDGASRSYYQVDGLGSTRLLTDASGNVSLVYDYQAFGELLNQSGSGSNTYLFTGEQFDQSLDLTYLRARYYDMGTGRFVSVDPFEGFLDSPIGHHDYKYSFDNPAVGIDPSGHYVLLEYAWNLTQTIAGLVLAAQCIFSVTKTPLPPKLDNTLKQIGDGLNPGSYLGDFANPYAMFDFLYAYYKLVLQGHAITGPFGAASAVGLLLCGAWMTLQGIAPAIDSLITSKIDEIMN